MKRFYALRDAKHQDRGMQKYYILTRPTKLSDLTVDDLYDDSNHDHNEWRKRAREFRDRKLRELDGISL
jgi:hypothetical protein